MAKVIIVKRADGGVDIIHPAAEMFDAKSRTRQHLISKGLVFNSQAEVMAYIIGKDVPEGADYRVANDTCLPADRSFRDAWCDVTKSTKVDIDVTKAQEIHRNNLRQMRKPLLEKLDVEFMRAVELGADTSVIVSKKQALRDVTNIDLPKNIDELKVTIPDILKGDDNSV